MNASPRTIILEDRAGDADLMLMHLERAGLTPRWLRVETERDFTAALGPEIDLILADYQLPHYDAMQALARVRETGLEIPFLIVSGNINEELAVSAMRQGASDFVIKDRLARLGPAVLHVLEQRRVLEESRQAHEALRLREEVARRIVAAAEDLTRVLPMYSRLSDVAHALASTPEQSHLVESADAPVREYLEEKTAGLLEALAGLPAAGNPPLADLPTEQGHRLSILFAAVQDTVQVLESTRRSFKSRALGQLRARLAALLRAQDGA